jgi:hypothetical protein
VTKLNASGLLKQEPVIVGGFVLWLLTQAGLVLVGRYHMLSASSWSALSQAIAPAVTAGVLALAGWLLRRAVTPSWKWLELHAPVVATVVDDVGVRLLDDALAKAQAIYPMPAAPAEPEPAA